MAGAGFGASAVCAWCARARRPAAFPRLRFGVAMRRCARSGASGSGSAADAAGGAATKVFFRNSLDSAKIPKGFPQDSLRTLWESLLVRQDWLPGQTAAGMLSARWPVSGAQPPVSNPATELPSGKRRLLPCSEAVWDYVAR